MQIQLRNPDDKTFRKGRAVIPINNMLIAALQEARGSALPSYVIEGSGAPVKSLKKGIATTARNARISDVSPHIFRHTAAVWMAEAGVPMSEIAQYLGHSSTSVTEKVYARFSPNHLRGAASVLELPTRSTNLQTRFSEPKEKCLLLG